MVNPAGPSPARCTHVSSSPWWLEGLILSSALTVRAALVQTMTSAFSLLCSHRQSGQTPQKKLGASSLAFPFYPVCWEARSMWEICRGKPCSKTQPSGKWVKENERDVGKDIQKVMHNSAGQWHLRCFPSPTTGIQPPASGPSAHLGWVESSLSQKLLSLYKDWIKYSKVGVFWKFQEESKSGRL